MLRFLCVLAVVALIAAPARAQQPSLNDVLARLDTYLLQYEQMLASVVAEEQYRQVVSVQPFGGSPFVIQRRSLLSDFALARATGGQTWTGFRDTFEVDGTPVRDREARLAALLGSGSAESSAQALRIARENARYNLGEDVAVRTINVPTVALDLVHPSNRPRVSFSRSGGETIDGVAAWRLVYTERSRPTIIRDHEGKDRRAFGSIWLNPSSGEVLRTTLQWDGIPRGSITVTYQQDAGVGARVPATMVEEYRREGMRVDGEATYTHYRRFQTSARLVR